MTTATATRASTRKTAKATVPFDYRQLDRAAMIFRLLGEQSRLRIVMLLADGPQHVGAMCAALGFSQPSASHLLSGLRVSGLVSVDRRGKENHYSLTDRGREAVRAARAAMEG